MLQVGLRSLAFTPLWNPDDADWLLPSVTAQGVRVIETSLLGSESFDFIGMHYAGERHGVEIVCSLGLLDALDTMIRGDEVTDYLAFT